MLFNEPVELFGSPKLNFLRSWLGSKPTPPETSKIQKKKRYYASKTPVDPCTPNLITPDLPLQLLRFCSPDLSLVNPVVDYPFFIMTP